MKPQFTALRYFYLDGTDRQPYRGADHVIHRYIAWRNRHTPDPKPRKVVKRASTIKRSKAA